MLCLFLSAAISSARPATILAWFSASRSSLYLAPLNIYTVSRMAVTPYNFISAFEYFGASLIGDYFRNGRDCGRRYRKIRMSCVLTPN